MAIPFEFHRTAPLSSASGLFLNTASIIKNGPSKPRPVPSNMEMMLARIFCKPCSLNSYGRPVARSAESNRTLCLCWAVACEVNNHPCLPAEPAQTARRDQPPSMKVVRDSRKCRSAARMLALVAFSLTTVNLATSSCLFASARRTSSASLCVRYAYFRLYGRCISLVRRDECERARVSTSRALRSSIELAF